MYQRPHDTVELDLSTLMSEKDWLEQMMWTITPTLGWMAYHTHDSRGGEVGFPDLVIIKLHTPDVGRVVYTELKTETGKLSSSQEFWLDALAEGGQETYLWRPSDYEQVGQVLTMKPKVIRSWRDWLT